MKVIFLTILILTVCFSVNAKIWTLSDKNLDIQFDDQSMLLKVTDKRCSKTWEQTPLKEKFTVKQTTQKGNTLNVFLEGQFPVNVSFCLNESSALEINLTADNSIAFNELAFPSAFVTPNPQHYILETDGEGLLLPADDLKYPLGNGITYSCGGGLAMAWMGVVDNNFQSGYMAILETPFDACLRTFRDNGLVTFSPVWLPSMGQFSYDRKVTYHFFDKGGYVAQCKKYREYAWKKNHVITLKENQQKTPAMEKMIGAVHIYVWDNAREVSFARELKSSGIDKAFILWDANHVPYPEIDYDSRLKELGYATGGYELFTDLKLKDTISYPVDLHGPYRFARTTYPGLFNELVTRKRDGKTNFNQFGHTACPSVMQPHIKARVERELKEYPHESYFLDVYQANGLFECYSEKHPLSRQGYAEEVIKNQKMIASDYHQYLGGEWGADYCGSNAVYVHGMMTLQRTWWGSGIEKKGTIYYTGDWSSNPRPTQMIGTRVANDTYLKYSINEYTRVPLYELVYHDAIVTSWRWEDGNHHTPELWWKKDLFNILYGTAPLWNLDRNRWEEYKYTFVESYKNICPWLQQIGYDEMISHRFVTTDHTVQETVFSSGKRVVVNFGMSDFQYEGKVLKAKSFITLSNYTFAGKP
ncbi:MAG TPA: glycoside hydrolase [Prolixibacteraceae bacterium]|nr:glycoside hydrolase [Prolixibacteraceae bacterium]